MLTFAIPAKKFSLPIYLCGAAGFVRGGTSWDAAENTPRLNPENESQHGTFRRVWRNILPPERRCLQL
jgi:hypothetical protein